MSGGAYIAGVVQVAAVLAAAGFAALRLRARFVPSLEGAPARLAEAVIGVGLLVVGGELLGLLDLLRPGWVIAAFVALAAATLALRRPAAAGEERPEAPRVQPLAVVVAVGVSALLFAHWGVEIKKSLDQGITNFDSLWYHLPFAADMVQSASVRGLHFTDPLFLNWFYPQNSELLHALGMMLLGRDTLSLFINLGWLALTLLAAWCLGRPLGRGAICVVAVAVVLDAHTLIVREPGAAKNDLAGAALLLACAALLVNARSGRAGGRAGWSAGPLAVAGLAAGLALGTKLTVIAAVAALSVGVVALAPASQRRRSALIWFAPLLAGCAFWYLRNVVVAGNPLPWIRHVGPLTLPGPVHLQQARPSFAIVHYATDTRVWNDFFFPGLHQGFGILWPVVLGAGAIGAALVLWRGPGVVLRMLGAVSLLAMLAYLFTPLSAAGEQGAPVAFGINIRFLLPALVLGLALLPNAFPFRSPAAGWALMAALGAVLLISDRPDTVLSGAGRGFALLLACLAVLIPAVLLYLRARRGLPPVALAGGLVALAAAAVAIGYPVQRDYLRRRWAAFDTAQSLDRAYRWAQGVSHARIGLAGTTAGFQQYGFFGRDLTNRVRYLGQSGSSGAFSAIPTCAAFRAAVNAGRLDYLITTPFLNFNDPGRPIFSPEASWVRGQRALRPILREGPVTVWRVSGSLDPTGCASIRGPRRYVPRLD